MRRAYQQPYSIGFGPALYAAAKSMIRRQGYGMVQSLPCARTGVVAALDPFLYAGTLKPAAKHLHSCCASLLCIQAQQTDTLPPGRHSLPSLRVQSFPVEIQHLRLSRAELHRVAHQSMTDRTEKQVRRSKLRSGEVQIHRLSFTCRQALVSPRNTPLRTASLMRMTQARIPSCGDPISLSHNSARAVLPRAFLTMSSTKPEWTVPFSPSASASATRKSRFKDLDNVPRSHCRGLGGAPIRQNSHAKAHGQHVGDLCVSS